MKKLLILVLLILFCSGSAFGGEFEETLKKAKQGDAKAPSEMTIPQAPNEITPSGKVSLGTSTGGGGTGTGRTTTDRKVTRQ